jgi:uncharacterized protein YjbI with pentapeptide repeats
MRQSIHQEFIRGCHRGIYILLRTWRPLVDYKKKLRFKQEPSDKNLPPLRRLWRWTGWSEKKLWDWQALLFIPVTIALIASLFTQCQNNRQQDIEKLRAERDMLEAYFEHVGTLLLEEDLRTEGETSDARLLARARTLTVLDGVSGDRKVRMLEFLYETKLTQYPSHGEPPVISLRFADLRDAHLVKRSILSNTDLDRSELDNAKLSNANLINTNLPRADLYGADLRGADLSGADLSKAKLTNAKGVTCQQIQDAKSVEGATMPNGQKYDDWRKDKGCGE